jgi:acetyl esterase/lipase
VGIGKDVYPPDQPTNGYGSNQYQYLDMSVEKYGSGEKSYYIFKPLGYTQKKAPLIVFFHGWLALEPENYWYWIKHIVRKGNIVLFPVFQNYITNSLGFIKNSADAILDGIKILLNSDLKVDLNRVGFIGHSVGGIVSVDLAIKYKEKQLPKPKFVLSVEPGSTNIHLEINNKDVTIKGIQITKLYDLSKFPSDVNLITIVGENDTEVFDYDAKTIFQEATAKNKLYVSVSSDNYGSSPLVADHYFPSAPKEGFKPNAALSTLIRIKQPEVWKNLASIAVVNALDYYVTYKFSDFLEDVSFNNKSFFDTDIKSLSYMGTWSDGTPVKELDIMY